jgi:hypothetical protein
MLIFFVSLVLCIGYVENAYTVFLFRERGHMQVAGIDVRKYKKAS